MPSTPNLRLTVLVPREQASAHSSRNSTDGQHPPQSATDKSRSFLLVIKEPENVSLGDLANRIKDHWQELWPTESDRPLQIKQLVNGAYPDTAFTARCSVADIWVDSGRREREGFDQHGIVRVIPVPSSSTPTPPLRHQRAASVFQDVEGAAREAKRKLSASGISPKDSLPGPSATTPTQNKEQTDPQHHQSKRPRLTEETDLQSPSTPERVQITTSSPMYYNGRRVPSFALPRGHRRHLTNTSNGSPEIGLGLGITASSFRDKIASDKLAVDGIQKLSSMPPPPPRYQLRGSSNSFPLESTSQDSSPLGTRKPAERPYNSVPRDTSRTDDRRPRTRAAQKALGSGKRSHHARDSSDPKTTPKPKLTPDYCLEKGRTEAEKVIKLLKNRKTNPECLPILRDMSDLHKEMTDLKVRSGLTATERKRLIGITRKRLGRRRNRLEKFKKNGQLYDDSDAHTITSEEEDAGDGLEGGRDKGSQEDMSEKNSKCPRIEKRNLLADFAAVRRISSLRAYSTGVKLGDNPQSHNDKEPDGHGIQVVIRDNGTEQAPPSARASSVNASQSNGALPGNTATEANENEDEDNMTDSDGEDIQYEAEVPQVEHSSPTRNSTISQRASPRNGPPLGADNEEEENGVNGVYSTAREVVLSEVAQLVAAIERFPEQQDPPGKVGLLGRLLQQKREAIFSSKGRKDESTESSEDETSEDDSGHDPDGDCKVQGDDI